jgi:5-methylcytosine-specific restriction endonuclease McrA
MLRQMKTKKSKIEREEFVRITLKKQNSTCAFAGNDPKFCWNHPRDKTKPFLKLEWGHKVPTHYGKSSQNPDNLILLCARCNNHIQSSRKIKQLIPELEHKLKNLKSIDS